MYGNIHDDQYQAGGPYDGRREWTRRVSIILTLSIIPPALATILFQIPLDSLFVRGTPGLIIMAMGTVVMTNIIPMKKTTDFGKPKMSSVVATAATYITAGTVLGFILMNFDLRPIPLFATMIAAIILSGISLRLLAT